MKNLFPTAPLVLTLLLVGSEGFGLGENPLLLSSFSQGGGIMDYDVNIKVCQNTSSKTLNCKNNCTSYSAKPKQCLPLPTDHTGGTPENLEMSCNFISKCFQYNGYDGTTCSGSPLITGASACNLCQDNSITLCNSSTGGVTLKSQCDMQCNNCQFTKTYPFNTCMAPPDSKDARLEILPGFVSCATVNVTKFNEQNCSTTRGGSSYGYSLSAGECDDNWGNGISVEYECTPKGISSKLPQAPAEVLNMIKARVEKKKRH